MRYLIILLLMSSFLARADSDTVKEVTRAVDGIYFKAFVLPVGNEDRIVVRLYEPRRIAEFSLLSEDSEHGGHIENIQWSKDGQFLVFSTSSSGGHSAWNFRTYIFSTQRSEFISVDDVTAPATSPNFSFADASHLQIETLRSKPVSTDDTEKRVLDLNTLPWKKPKTEQLVPAD